LKNIFWDTTWKHRNLGSVTHAGLINNLNDGMAWGIFPILLASKGFSIAEIGIVTAVYPAVWGIGQLFTGKMADNFCKKICCIWHALAPLFCGFGLQYDVSFIALSAEAGQRWYIPLSWLMAKTPIRMIGQHCIFRLWRLLCHRRHTHRHHRRFDQS
jgi:MFS family permease